MRKTILITPLLFLITLGTDAQDGLLQDTTFKPSGKISGYLFGDFAYKIHANEQERGSQQYSGLKKDYSFFNIRRLYLQYGYQFSPRISSHVTLAHESGMEVSRDRTNLLPDGNRTVFVKHAYIQFDEAIPRAAIVLGQQATPTFSRLSETIWRYRSVEKTVADMRDISASSDLGLGVYGKMGANERVGYDMLFANNSGTQFTGDNHKKIYTSLYAYFFGKKLVIQINYEYNKTDTFPTISGNTQLVKTFVGYKTAHISAGVEVFKQFNKNATLYRPPIAVNPLTTGSAATGISAFYTQRLRPEKFIFFARIDWYNPDADFKSDRFYLSDYPSTKEVFATAGVDYEPVENIHFIPNIWLNRYESKSINGTPAPPNRYDLVGRITFYYQFNK